MSMRGVVHLQCGAKITRGLLTAFVHRPLKGNCLRYAGRTPLFFFLFFFSNHASVKYTAG